ncbi:MAG: glycosyltransferase [Paludibacteraceae bacterium]|nr:glycosyltransferase [Paludibacteraceae bacterium]
MANHSIAILTDPYGKPSYSPRLRNICDFLVEKGWNIEVYTEQFEPLSFAHSYPIYTFQLYKNKHVDWAVKSLWSLLTDWKNRRFAKLVTEQCKHKHYDLVFCTTFSTFPLYAALHLAEQHHIPLHIDLRDIEEQAPNSQLQAHRGWWTFFFRRAYRNINIRRRNRVILKADQVTTISPWHAQFLKKLNPNTSLIYNGYDARIFYPSEIHSDDFILLYTGRFYESIMRDPTLLFKALQKTKLPHLKVVFYTDNEGHKKLNMLNKKYDTAQLTEIHDYVASEQIPNLLQKASIILVFSNQSSRTHTHGIMTTKFFEALGVEKPVLCVRSDEECLAQVIRETNAGIAAKTVEEVEKFIQDKYHEWQQNGFTRQPVNQTQRQCFTRQRQAQQFEQLFLSAIDSYKK